MPKAPCKPCQSKKGRRVASFSDVKYVVNDAAGRLVQEFGNKPSAAKFLNRHPGYTLHPVTQESV